jgi:hypothetical protein
VVATPPAPVIKDLSFGELAAQLPEGAINYSTNGISLNISLVSEALSAKDYGVSELIYALLVAVSKAEKVANSGRLSASPIKAVTFGSTQISNGQVRISATLNGVADLLDNLKGVQALG